VEEQQAATTDPVVMQCVQCQTKLESACGEGDTMQPYGGCEVQIIAAYGSTKFDDCLLGRKFRGVICDACVEEMLPRLQAQNGDSRLLIDNDYDWEPRGAICCDTSYDSAEDFRNHLKIAHSGG